MYSDQADLTAWMDAAGRYPILPKEEILRVIQIIFRSEFKNDSLIINFDSNSQSIENWDSVTNIVLMDSIEREFNVEFSIDVIYESNTIGDWIDYILENLNSHLLFYVIIF
jgi:acyl carrier protein